MRLIFLLPALVVGVPTRKDTCRLVDAIPFFRPEANQRSGAALDSTEDVAVLTEFARFMNRRVPRLLEEFAEAKQRTSKLGYSSRQTLANLRMGRQYHFNHQILSLFQTAEKLTKEKQAGRLFFGSSEEEASGMEMEELFPVDNMEYGSGMESSGDEDGSGMEEGSGEDGGAKEKIKETIKKVVKKVVDAMKDAVNTIKSKPLKASTIKAIFSGIIDGIKKTLLDVGIPLPGKDGEEDDSEEMMEASAAVDPVDNMEDGSGMEEGSGEEGGAKEKIKETIKKVVKKVVDAMKDVVNTIKSKPLKVSTIKAIFSGIIDGVKKTILDAGIPLPGEDGEDDEEEEEEDNELIDEDDSNLSYFHKWPAVCTILWYPYHEEKCQSARCMACAPAMMASAQVCKRSHGTVSQRCLAGTLGKGFCNACIADYAEPGF